MRHGIIYVRHNGTVTRHQPIGYRDIANELTNDQATSFGTASAGKVFVAVAVLRLIEQGRLHLEDTLEHVLKDVPGRLDPSTTLFELLTHTSNVPDYCDEDEVPDYELLWQDLPNYRIRTGRDLLPLFVDKPPLHTRRGIFHYNNSAFVLLGLVLEEATGEPLDKHLHDTIFAPLGMTRTGYHELDRLPANCANGYIIDADESWRTNIYSIDAKGSGAGGAFTNPTDIALFWDGLFDGTLLGAAMLRQMLYPHVFEEHFGYGLGIWLYPDGTPNFVGEDPGVTFISSFNHSDDLLITVISNARDDVFALHNQIREELRS